MSAAQAHRLTREEGCGYCTALKDLRAWHATQLDDAATKIGSLREGLGASDPAHMTAVAILEGVIDKQRDAIREIDRLEIQQRKETFGR